MTQALVLVNATLVFLYGFFLNIGFAGGCETKKDRRIIGVLCAAIWVAQVLCWRIFGFTAAWRLYPLIAHIPLTLTLVFALKKPLGVSVVSLLTAYFCCQLPRWIATMFFALFGTEIAYQISYSLVIFPIFFLLNRYFTAAAYKAMSYSKRSLLLFGGLPMFYYLFDYVTRVYTSILYDGIRMISEFLPAAMALFYVVFVTAYHDEVQRRNKTELQNSLLAIQFEQAKSDVVVMGQMQEQTSAYRHDMRHHFTMINGYLESGEPEKAIQYIKGAKGDIDRITPKRYCENAAINLVLSAFSDRGEKLGVILSIEANIPNALPIPETALCTLFSNGLENAVIAAAQITDKKQKIVRVNCQIHKGNLLIYIKNPYDGEVIFRDNLPKNDRPEHGYGVKSIKLIADMQGGFCSFEAKDGIFTLKVVLPIGGE
ncbi:MAG: GHKL domain-containing protein [Firmicutes bacterium]|nr:GHKL domain-containing protein [Bacillota bacterium]